MAYYNLTTIKSELGITDSSLDSVLTTFGGESDDYVNSRLNAYFSTPIPSPDNNIVNASNYGAIGRYYNSRIYASEQDNVNKGDTYLQLADKFIDAYLEMTARTKAHAKVPQYFVATSGNFMNQNNSFS